MLSIPFENIHLLSPQNRNVTMNRLLDLDVNEEKYFLKNEIW